ncbi:TPA: HAMP domain-containing histidine kinase, partial [Streptococcus agalactiae]|nr:HAMP domain-containing histidine kinase [Streptococcus agalactiae]
MSKPIKISKFKKNVSDSHFIHFFTVFSGIFLVMTVIILQVMRYGVYSSVDSSLKYISTHPKNYINMVMSHTAAYLDNSNIASVKLKPGGQTVANTDIILFTSEEEVINYFDAFSNYQFLKPNKKNLGGISELTLTNIFGQDETYHAVTVKVNNPAYPNVTYMTAIVNIDQLVNAKERYEKIIIFVMTTFWIISIGASIYLAKWAQKPIIENYERQKAFVENASHELRTPLAVLQNRLETLFRKPNATILENSENIASSLDEVRNMRILTTNLLNLARRDDGIKPELAVIKPTLFDSIFENYDLIAQENGKNFTGHNMIQDSFKTDKTLLKQLMTILFDNAI